MSSLIGFVNYFKIGAITANNAEPTLPATNLSRDQVNAASGWQTQAGVVTFSAGALLRCDAPVGGVEWRVFGLFGTNLTNTAMVNVSLWNNGAPPTFVKDVTISGPVSGYRQVAVVLAQDYTADFVQFIIDDPTNPDGHISVGGAFAGPAWLPLTGITWDTSYGATPAFRSTQTEGGQLYQSLKYRQRYWNLALDGVRDSEAWDDLGEVTRIADMGGNVLFVPNIYSVDILREAVFGTLRSTADVTFPARMRDQRSWRGQVLERL